MISLLTTRLKRSLGLSCKAPSKRPLINFYPAIPMSPGGAATQQQKTLIKALEEALTSHLRVQISERKPAPERQEPQPPTLFLSLCAPHLVLFCPQFLAFCVAVAIPSDLCPPLLPAAPWPGRPDPGAAAGATGPGLGPGLRVLGDP